MMKIFTQKIKEANIKTIFLLITYTILAILAVVYFDSILKIIGMIFNILSPFIYGIIFAFILQLPTPWIEKQLKIEDTKRKTIVATILSMIFAFMVIAIILTIILPQVIDNLTTLANNLPSMMDKTEVYLQTLLNSLSLDSDIVKMIEEYQNQIGSAMLSSVSKFAPSLLTGIQSITSSVANVFMGFIIAIYMSIDKNRLLYQCDRVTFALLKEEHYLYLKDVMNLISKTFRQFFAGQLTESIIIGVLCYIGCLILQIPYASIAAIVIGVTNIIPYFGPIIGTGISALLIVFISPIKAIIFIIFGTLLQQFESNLIYPHVVGNSVGLSALWVLFAITVGGGLFGIIGMIFGLPVFSVIYELFRRFILDRLKLKEKQSC